MRTWSARRPISGSIGIRSARAGRSGDGSARKSISGGSAMRARQRGVTAIGWLILLIPFAILIYAGIRLTPVYLNYMKVARALNELGDEFRGGGANPDAIRSSIRKHFQVDEVDYPQ